MKKTYSIVGLLVLSVVIYNCSQSKKVQQSSVGNPYPSRTFDSTPSGEYLNPEASMKTFNLPAGYHLQLVASEPMIKEPVAIAWDGNARMYVAEMLTYMQDADATGEQKPVSRISLLEDTDNDGKMDKSSVFIDSLLLPRMIQCIDHELLVNETNTITINAYKDTNGDGKADSKRTVFEKPDYKMLDNNMEHQRSGLDYNIDNYMYITYDNVRFRYKDGMLQADSIYSGPGGQWGVTHDNYGRLFLTNAGAESPLVRVQMNPSYGALDVPDQANNEFQLVWPIIATPDVQGGQLRLRADSTLNHFTGACGQSIYRGNTFPQDFNGDYIICEPVGRIIRRAKVINLQGKIMVQNAYYRQEFIASTDMNFRPVNSYTGPDGNLYIVDMHRGIIQQGNWTRPGTFLRKRIDERELSKNIGHGRIYRVVYDGYTPGAKPKMLDEPVSKLVTYLDNKNGWWRDNAQKQIVVKGDKSVVPVLKQIVRGEQATLSEKPSHLARLHALWTLEGLESVDQQTLGIALRDEHPQIRKAALVISEAFLRKNDDFMKVLTSMKNDSSAEVRLQLLRSVYATKGQTDTSFAHELMVSNASNDIFSSTQKAMDRNILVKTYGARLASLQPEERRSIMAGSTIFNGLCVTCHGPGGKGVAVAGTSALAAPPFPGSKRIAGDKSIMARILLHGLSGAIDGKEYPSVMPALGDNNDEWVASVVNYVRYEFGNTNRRFRAPTDTASLFATPGDIAQIRKQYQGRSASWTVNELEGSAVPASTVSTAATPVKETAPAETKPAVTPAKKAAPAAPKKATDPAKPTFASVQPLLTKNACLSCHNADTKLIGPAYKEVAKKKYPVAQLVALMQKPNPANWPGYTAVMPPMAHVPKAELTQIALWIKSLEPGK